MTAAMLQMLADLEFLGPTSGHMLDYGSGVKSALHRRGLVERSTGKAPGSLRIYTITDAGYVALREVTQ